jgi:hypothetical protein
MFVFYTDEAGCTGALPSAMSPVQPVFILAGLVLREDRLKPVTHDLLNLKQRYFPRLLPASANFLDWITAEVKGADVRRQVRGTSRDNRRHALGVMDKLLALLERHDAKVLGRLYVKPIGGPFAGKAVYTSAVQSLATDFQQFLQTANADGLMIMDSRNKPLNVNVSHSVFTQKFKATGDAYDRLLEMPLFGHSDNHAGIQVADLLCSALLFPMATYAYCQGHVNNLHVDIRYMVIRDRFGERIKRLQFRYQDATKWWRGGITVSDGIGHQKGSLLFGPATP